MDAAVDLLKSGLWATIATPCLTFDDGYRDNLEMAYPMLKDLKAPFTVFVASGLVDRTSELWWFALERIIAANETVVFTQAGEQSGLPCRNRGREKCLFRASIVDYLTLEVGEFDQRKIIRALAKSKYRPGSCGSDG